MRRMLLLVCSLLGLLVITSPASAARTSVGGSGTLSGSGGTYGLIVSNTGSDDCSIIDTRARREVARIKVGKAPKRLVAVAVPAA